MAFRLPPSPFPLRRALSLTEVLIAMGILTLGLLGVAALFPVGSFYMQKADIADRGSAIAQAVMSDIVSRGMLNPGAWYVMIPPAGPPTQPAYKLFPSDGLYAPSPPAPNPVRGSYGRPFALTLADALNQPTAPTDSTLISKQFGSAFVIDPMGVAAMAYPHPLVGDQTWNLAATAFPASVTGYIPSQFYSAWIQPWGPLWPVRRMTFRQPSTGWQMDATMAEHYFRGHDDLGADLPQRDDRPAIQNWDTTAVGSTQMPLTRQWTGDYSWIVTVVPTTNAARDGMARNPEGHTYDVSVVVFFKRVLPSGAISVAESTNGRNDFLTTMGANERAVNARVVSTGLSGGELLLERLNDGITASPFDQLRTGQWIMLCGPHPNSNFDASTPPRGESRFALNWYQVMSIEGRDARLNSDGTDTPPPPTADPERRLISVRGPEWPWAPGDAGSDKLCVAICRGAVAVHTKTMRLESPRSSPVNFGGGGDPTTNPPKYKLN